MANTFDWIEIRTTDPDRAARFYASLWNWQTLRREEVAGLHVHIVDTGGQPRAENLRRGGIAQAAEGEPGGVLVYVRVDDIEATLKRVEELGGRVALGKEELPGGYAVRFYDPSGNLLAIYQDKEQPPSRGSGS